MYDIWNCGAKVNFANPTATAKTALSNKQSVDFTVDYSSLGRQEYEWFKKFTDISINPLVITPLRIYN